MVRRQRRLEAAPAANTDAGDREWTVAAGGDEYGDDGIGRSLWTDRGGNSAQDPYRAGGALRAECECQLLHAAWRLVRISVCDNFCRRGGDAFCGSWRQ